MVPRNYQIGGLVKVLGGLFAISDFMRGKIACEVCAVKGLCVADADLEVWVTPKAKLFMCLAHAESFVTDCSVDRRDELLIEVRKLARHDAGTAPIGRQ